MGTINEGRYETDRDVDAVLDRMIDSAQHYFGEDLSQDSLAAIRVFYTPIAEQVMNLQGDLRSVLNSAQIDYVEGPALDLFTAQINVNRFMPQEATGDVTFSRNSDATQDYDIPEGTIVQTFSNDPVKFETTERVTLAQGTQSVSAPIQAVEGGLEGNVAADRIIEFHSKPAGIENVNNPQPTDGGTDVESDESLRERAKEQLAEGAGASADALLSEVSQISEQVRSVSIRINDSAVDKRPDGLPDHSFEIIAEAPDEFYQDIAQVIAETKAIGDISYAGLHGTEVTRDAELFNGQQHPISFSTPDERNIYVEAEIEVKDSFAGEDALRDALTDYIGGTDVDGEPVPGDLRAGDDVIHGEVEFALRTVQGVYDVTNLYIDEVSDPNLSENIPIDETDLAYFRADEPDRFTLTTTDV